MARWPLDQSWCTPRQQQQRRLRDEQSRRGAGLSENGLVDPSTGGPAINAVLFKHGRVVNLGTLAGGYESFAFTINDRGDVAGFSSNGIADPFSMFGWPTQTRAFFWRHGVMRDIGTLGGPDSAPEWLNARGQVVGESYTNSTPNAATGIPTMHPFLWTRGRMQDLGTLGGTRATAARVNNRGQTVGNSNLAGDRVHHPYLWDRNRGLQDLGTLGGDSGYANWVDDQGDVVGTANLPGSQVSHGFLWTHGKMRDLPRPARRLAAAQPRSTTRASWWATQTTATTTGSPRWCGGTGTPPTSTR